MKISKTPEASDVTDSGFKKKTVKSRRPEGADIDRYKNIENWSYRKWTWEFLRRNEEFIAACKKVKFRTDEEKLIVARQFGLKQFKNFSESYKGASGSPKFSIGTITSWSKIKSEDIAIRLEKITLGSGEILIRYDLASAMQDTRALQNQLRSAEKLLNKRLKEYAAQRETEPDSHKPKAEPFGIYLRLLDLLATGKTQAECAYEIYPDDAPQLTPDEASSLVNKQIQKAKKYAREEYKYLSLKKGKPTPVNGIPLYRKRKRPKKVDD